MKSVGDEPSSTGCRLGSCSSCCRRKRRNSSRPSRLWPSSGAASGIISRWSWHNRSERTASDDTAATDRPGAAILRPPADDALSGQHRPRQEPLFFFFNDTATTEIYTLSLHDALPI